MATPRFTPDELLRPREPARQWAKSVSRRAFGDDGPGLDIDFRTTEQSVAKARSYLRGSRDRMDYPRYRREGLPTAGSLVGSPVGEFNARVKGEQKHWNRPSGAESILQLPAALLSEDGRLSRYFAGRPGCPFRKRHRSNKRPVPHPAQTAA